MPNTQSLRPPNLFRIAVLYFVIVFAVGFVLGPIRELLLVPNVGRRAAELMEVPCLLLAIVVTARWIVRRFLRDQHGGFVLGVGLLATVCVLAADVAVGVGLRDMSVSEVFTHRDLVSSLIYFGLLLVFAASPWLLLRLGGDRQKRASTE